MAFGETDLEHRASDPRPRLAATLGPLLERGPAGEALDAPSALALVADMGYAAVQWPATTPGLRPRDLDGSARRGLVASMRRLELRCAGIDLWIPPAHFLDPAHVDRAVDAVGQAVRLAADLVDRADGGAPIRPTVSVLLPSAPATASGGGQGAAASPSSGSDAQARLASLAALLAALGERDGIAIADHAVPPSPAAPAIGIDPAAHLAAGRDPAAEALAAGSRLAAARLVDCFRSGLRGPILEPGESRLDVAAYRVALDVLGFRAPLVVDARQWTRPAEGLAATLERWSGRPIRGKGTR